MVRFLQIFIKSIITGLIFCYICVIAIILYYKNLDKNTLQQHFNILNNYITKQYNINYNGKIITSNKEKIEISISNLTYKKNTINNIHLFIVFNELIKFRYPFYIKKIDGITLNIAHKSSKKHNFQDFDIFDFIAEFNEALNSIPRKIRLFFVHGFELQNMIINIMYDKVKYDILIDKIKMNSVKQKLLSYDGNISINGKFLDSIISADIAYSMNGNGLFLGYNTKLTFNNFGKMFNKIVKTVVKQGFIKTDIDKAEIVFNAKVLDNTIDMGKMYIVFNKMTLYKDSRLITLDEMKVSGSINGNIIKLNEFKILKDGKEVKIIDQHIIALSKDKISFYVASQINLLNVKNILDYIVIRSKKNNSLYNILKNIEAKNVDIIINIKHENMLNVHVKSDVVKIEKNKFTPSLLMKDMTIIANNEKIKIEASSINYKKDFMGKNVDINIDLINSKFNILFEKLNFNYVTIMKALKNLDNSKYVNLLKKTYMITGGNNLDYENINCDLKNVQISSDFNSRNFSNIFTKSRISARGKMIAKNIHIFSHQILKPEIEIIKQSGNNKFRIDAFFNDRKFNWQFFKDGVNIDKITFINDREWMSLEFFSKNLSIIKVYSESLNNERIVYLKGKYKESMNVDLLYKQLENQTLWEIDANGINFGHLIDRYTSYNKLKNYNRKDYKINFKGQNVLMKNDVMADKIDFVFHANNFSLKDLRLDMDLSSSERKEKIETMITDFNVSYIKSKELKLFFDAFFNTKDMLKMQNFIIKVLFLDKFTDLIFNIDDMYVNKKYFKTGDDFTKYNHTNIQSRYFFTENENILNINEGFVKDKTSKITLHGYYNIMNNFLNLYGKIDTAHKFNNIATMRNVSFLNKILTFGSKDGGYGVLSYKIQGNINHLNRKSITLGIDRTNFSLQNIGFLPIVGLIYLIK